MKIPLQFSAPLLLVLAGIASAEVPKKAPLSRYNGLWTNSPFTSKPPVVGEVEEANPLEDYALIGVSPIDNNGFRVTLINKKKPDERITVDSGKGASGFSIVGVDRKPGDPLGTAVRMKSGSKSGIVKFDEKLLTIAAPKPAAVQQPNIPGQPQQQPQLQPGQVPPVQRQPRPRVVPPPAPQAGQAQQPAQQNQRPQRRGN